jgi:GH15 family glucan-1,4-alpha-glucosidase
MDIILENQAASGAYLACPNFPTYQYSWFRDGSYIAYAMDRVGEHHSASRFFDWAAGVIMARRKLITQAVEKAQAGKQLGVDEILHTRYTTGGDAARDEWPNFQLDGFGTLLWAMGQHQKSTQTPLKESWRQACALLVDYLSALWCRPCFDCWEEFPDENHTYTLAAIYAGVRTSQGLLNHDYEPVLAGIKEFIHENAVRTGHFTKFAGTDMVDASLLGLSVPYSVFPIDDPRSKKTLEKIDEKLCEGGGLHRYAEDTYYGGGEWVLLTGWMGWYYAQSGIWDRALELKTWIEAQADEFGQLPEQVPATLNDPSMYQPWVDRWGEIARPLLWSHAMYLILANFLEAT